jgi:hypothetical protein
MATADEYAAWIVKNSAKRGSPEFDTVAQAYELAKREENDARFASQAAPPQQETPGIGQQLLGAGEAALTLGTGATFGTVGMVGGALGGIAQSILGGTFGTREANQMIEQAASQGAAALTRTPRGQVGQDIVQGVGRALQGVPPFIPIVGPLGTTLAQGARQAALPAIAMAERAVPMVQKTGQAIAAPVRGAVGRVQEMFTGEAAPAAPGALRSAGGAAATPLELQRATEAQMAGLRLTEGEVKRSPELLAWEKEKAKTPEYQAPFLERQQENNRAALAKFEQVLDETGAETGNLSDTGIKAVDVLMKGWEREKAKTTEMYNAFKASPEAQMKVDASPVLSYINDQPVGVANITGVTDTARQNAVRLGVAIPDADGQLAANPNATLGQLEEFRKSISAIGAASPNDKRLISELKKQVDVTGDPVGGNITRAMRAQRQRQAQKYENRAIVANLLLEKKGMSDARVPIEDVFQKSILSARPSEIQHLKRVLFTIGEGEGKQAWSELQGATVRHLMDSAEAGIGADNLPVISAAKLNKSIQSLDKNGKLDLVLGKSAAEEVRNLNQVLQYIQSTPPMTSINNSGTARTVMALMSEAAITGTVTGVPLPVIQGLKILRNEVKDRKIKARITKALNYKTGTAP